MEKCFKYLLKMNRTYKSFDKKIQALFEYYFLDKKLTLFLNSNHYLLKDKIKKLKILENKALAELNIILKNDRKHQNKKNN